MNREDTIKVLAILRGAYPQFYRDVTKQEALATVNLWAEMFAEDDVTVVAAAAKALIACDEKGYPPHIGAVRARIRQLTSPPEMTEGEAWALVSRAARRLDWLNPAKEWDRLPEAVRRVIGEASVLVEWAKVDADTFSTVIASNFQRSFRARQQSERDYAALPADVKALMTQAAAGLALEGTT